MSSQYHRLPPHSRVVVARRVARRRLPRTPLGQLLAAAAGIAVILLAAGVALVGLTAVGVVNALSSGLPDPANLDRLTFAQPTIVYDRTGKVELARFQQQDRRVVTYDQIPPLVLDAVTTAEDRTFWTNGGFDPTSIAAAAVQDVGGGASGQRGASTITQQLVRATLLPPSVLSGDVYLRKVLEIIQSARLTAAYPGDAGKQKIITAYLNQAYFGHQAYGIAAAAQIYFGVTDLSRLTPAQAALLAGLLKAPSQYDPYLYAVQEPDGRLVVPASAPAVVRRDWILQNLPGSARWTSLDPAAIRAATAAPVVLAGVHPQVVKAPQFVQQVRDQLEQMLGGADAVDTGGYRVITTLDWTAQQLAERDVAAAAIAPNLPRAQASALLAQLGVPKADDGWISRLRGKDLHDGLLIALDYRTGDVLAYDGSAGYYRTDLTSPQFQPEYDVIQAGRQPGSSFKPIVYTTAFDRNVLTPGSLLLDVSTDFGGGWEPTDFSHTEVGPILVRQGLQQSLNLVAVRALQRVGNSAVADTAAQFGIQFAGGKQTFMQAGLAGAIGTVETRAIDLTSAFGALADGGLHIPPRMILSIAAPDGSSRYQAPSAPSGTQAISPQSAFLMDDILDGNTNPKQNPVWAQNLELTNTPDGSRRPAAAKTGTADQVRDIATYGFLPPPDDPSAPGLAVGVWMGNSDHSAPRTSHPATSFSASQEWRAFIRDYTKSWPVAQFKRPPGVVQVAIDAWSGGAPGPWTRETRNEWFKVGTQPGSPGAIDPPGLLYSDSCHEWQVDPVKAELGPDSWKKDVANWLDRARHGVGVVGPYKQSTAYRPGASSWGGPLLGSCSSGQHGGGGGAPGPIPKHHRRRHQ